MKPASEQVKVEDNPRLVRDTFSKGVINTDRSAYASNKLRRKEARRKDELIARLTAEVDELRSEQEEIWAMVKKLVRTKSINTTDDN